MVLHIYLVDTVENVAIYLHSPTNQLAYQRTNVPVFAYLKHTFK